MKAVGFVWLCALCSVIESDAQVQMETLCSEEQQAELLAYWDSEVKKTKQKQKNHLAIRTPRAWLIIAKLTAFYQSKRNTEGLFLNLRFHCIWSLIVWDVQASVCVPKYRPSLRLPAQNQSAKIFCLSWIISLWIRTSGHVLSVRNSSQQLDPNPSRHLKYDKLSMCKLPFASHSLWNT